MPFAALLFAYVAPFSPVTAGALAFGFVIHLLGVLVERWLFFAEAKHVVTLYYGATTA